MSSLCGSSSVGLRSKLETGGRWFDSRCEKLRKAFLLYGRKKLRRNYEKFRRKKVTTQFAIPSLAGHRNNQNICLLATFCRSSSPSRILSLFSLSLSSISVFMYGGKRPSPISRASSLAFAINGAKKPAPYEPAFLFLRVGLGRRHDGVDVVQNDACHVGGLRRRELELEGRLGGLVPNDERKLRRAPAPPVNVCVPETNVQRRETVREVSTVIPSPKEPPRTMASAPKRSARVPDNGCAPPLFSFDGITTISERTRRSAAR